MVPGYAAVCLAALCLSACSLSLPPRFGDGDGSVADDGRDGMDSTDGADMDGVGDDGSGPCGEGLVPCGDTCVDPRIDPANCGACGHACAADRTCAGGECVCREGLTGCGGECIDTRSDPDHCGGCSNECDEGWVCNEGECSLNCSDGLTNCSGACVNLVSHPMHCGSCGHVCPGAVGARAVCDERECGLECLENMWDLDDEPGCEYPCTVTSDTETCDGADDNCDGKRDEGFPCVRGSETACTTSCGTEGSGTCAGDCALPTGNLCAGTEACNGADDDCDTVADEDFDCALGMSITCNTACETAGMRDCKPPSCAWGECCAPDEICHNGCDDDCNGLPDDGCGVTTPGDTCDNPITVTGSGGRFSGTTSTATQSTDGGCALGVGARDVYYSFTITTASDVYISTFGSSFDTVIYLSATCGGGDLGCSNNYSGAVLQSHIQRANLAPGTYTIAVDGNSLPDRGDYVLDVYINPASPAGDTCARAMPFDDIETGETGNTCGWDSIYRGTCSSEFPPTPPPEGVYFVVVPDLGSGLTAHFSTCNADTGYDTLMYLRTVCNSERLSDETACNDDIGDAGCTPGWKSRVGGTLSPGVYFLFIDGWCSSSSCDMWCGGYRITVEGL
ncbi:MAG: MXAN_6577-like cysteine-rich protein [Pseudomonadota bacterium]